MAYSIYALVDPRNNKVRYIGMSQDPEARYKQHVSRRSKRWIRELVQQGMQPLLQIVESDIPDQAQAQEREKHWIHFYEGQGHALENLVYNECAWRERSEKAELHERLYSQFACQLPHKQAELLTRMTESGYDTVGPCAWDDSYRVVVGTLQLLKERYGIRHNLNEIDAAKLTFNLFGYKWTGGGEV